MIQGLLVVAISAWAVAGCAEAAPSPAAVSGQDDARRPARPARPGGRGLDPSPPIVHTLEPVAAPEAGPYPELTFHGPPGPLGPGAVTADFPCFMGPDHDSHSKETRLLKDFPGGGPALVWEMASGSGFAAPVVAGDRLVYTHRTGDESHVDCLHPETGRRYWRFSRPCRYRDRYIQDNGPRSTPVISGDRVYVHDVMGGLHCLDLATGRVVWQRQLTEEFRIPVQFFGVVSSPIIHGDHLIQNVGAPGGPCVAAFDKASGAIVWGSGDRWGPSCASPVIASVNGRERLFVMTGGDSRPPTGGLMVIDPVQGAVDFEYPFRSRTYESVNGASPVVAGDRVFITASYGTGTAGLALKPGGGYEELWKTRRIGMQFSNPVFHDGYLYAIDGRSDRLGAIICLDPASGQELARTDLAWDETLFYKGAEKLLPISVGEGSLLHVDGRFLCLGDNGHLLWLECSPKGTEVIARASLFRANQTWTPPVVCRGLLYVRQNTPERFGREPKPPRLLCFDLRGP